MTKRSTKTALLLSVLSLILCFAMLLGTTFAWFTDSVTSGNNVITSGNLDVVLEYKTDWADDWTPVDATTKVFDENALYEPGYAEVVYLRVSNAGTLALKYNLNLNIVDEKTSTNVNGEEFALSDYLEVGYYTQNEYVDGENDAETRIPAKFDTRENALSNVTLTTLSKADSSIISNSPVLVGDKTAQIAVIVLTMPETVGNEANAMTDVDAPEINLGLVLNATQNVEEADSFDNKYDENATYPQAITNVIKGGESIKVGDIEVILPMGLPEAAYTLNISNQYLTTNNGETTLNLDVNLLKDNVKVAPVAGVEYTLCINVGKNLPLNNVTHNGEIVAYTYDLATGIVKIATESFSPFAVSYKANTVLVNDALEMQAALGEGKSVVLNANIDVTADTPMMYTSANGAHFYINGKEDITIDFNGFVITVAEDALMKDKYANAVLLINKSNVDLFDSKGNGGIVANNQAIPVYALSRANINIYSGNYETNAYKRNESAVYVNNPNVVINVYGGTFAKYAFNVHDGKCGDYTAIVLHDGIEYENFYKGSIDLTASDINGNRIAIAPDCELVETENGYKVVKK